MASADHTPPPPQVGRSQACLRPPQHGSRTGRGQVPPPDGPHKTGRLAVLTLRGSWVGVFLSSPSKVCPRNLHQTQAQPQKPSVRIWRRRRRPDLISRLLCARGSHRDPGLRGETAATSTDAVRQWRWQGREGPLSGPSGFGLDRPRGVGPLEGKGDAACRAQISHCLSSSRCCRRWGWPRLVRGGNAGQ